MLIDILYVLCGILNYGVLMGNFSAKFPYMNNRGIAIFGLITGVFGTLATILFGIFTRDFKFRNFSFKQKSCEERCEIFNQQFPNLGRNYFERNHT